MPSEYKSSSSLSEFEIKIKKWNGVRIFPCRLCKDYQPNIRYVWYDMNIQTIFIVLYETFLVFTNISIDRYFLSIGFYDFREIMTESEKHQHDVFLNTFWWLILCWFILFLALANYQPVLPTIWCILCPWVYVEFSYLTWLTGWVIDIFVECRMQTE